MRGRQFGGWREHANAIVWIAGLVVLIVAAGCSSPGGSLTRDASPEVKQAAVKERVTARWAALIRGDVDSAYGFLSPTSRETVSLAAYRARSGSAQWRAAAIESITCEVEACKVELRVTYDYPVQGRMMQGIQTSMSETWVLDKGAAWLVFL